MPLLWVLVHATNVYLWAYTQHAPQFPNIGTGSTLELLDWLDEFTFPLESKFSDGEFARRVYEEVVKRTLRCGVSNFMSHNLQAPLLRC